MDTILGSSGDQRVLFSVLNKLLHWNARHSLPIYDSPVALTNRFADHFTNQIYQIRTYLDQQLRTPTPDLDREESLVVSSILDKFPTVTTEEMESIIRKTNCKSFSLDPIPTTLLKMCLPTLLPAITHIVNCSLGSTIPELYKEAILIPILKKPYLNTEVLNNYRAISNLPYLSKVIEKAVANQLTDYTTIYNLDEFMQAYRPNHSKETALMQIHYDVLWSHDNNESILLVSLDLSVAFDTIDHNTLLYHLGTTTLTLF